MEEELFLASDAEKVVKALGIKVNCALSDLHVYVNGVDVAKNLVVETIRVTFETVEKVEKAAQ